MPAVVAISWDWFSFILPFLLISTDSPGERLGLIDISDASAPEAMGFVDLPGEPTTVRIHGDYGEFTEVEMKMVYIFITMYLLPTFTFLQPSCCWSQYFSRLCQSQWPTCCHWHYFQVNHSRNWPRRTTRCCGCIQRRAIHCNCNWEWAWRGSRWWRAPSNATRVCSDHRHSKLRPSWLDKLTWPD